MNFVDFARAHGVLIGHLIEDQKWHRCATEAHPKKKNGAYRYMGVYGHIQDHANHPEPILWRPEESEIKAVDRAAMEANAKAAAHEIRKGQEQAAARANRMLAESTRGSHPYLVAKGFPEAVGSLWRDEKAGDTKLLIPMYFGGKVAGLQTVSDQGAHQRTNWKGELEDAPAFEKRFLPGQRTSECSIVRGQPAPGAASMPVFCEGFATGLSVERALRTGVRGAAAHIVVCFTAGNLLKLAKGAGRGIVVADYDRPSKHHTEQGGHGIAVAKEIGLPFWQSDREGEDFNDFELRVHTFKAGMALKQFFLKRPA